MDRNIFLKALGGAACALVSSALINPGTALAQYDSYHECEVTEEISPGYFDYYDVPECGEVGTGITSIAPGLTNIGDAMVNQQLNFGGFAGFASPTGRVRRTEHDGLTEKATGTSTGAFETNEASVFGNASYDLPGTYFGGKVRVSGLVGYNSLIQDNQAKSFKNEIDALIYGGSYLWSQGSFYSMSLIIGINGEVDGQNVGGNYSYDISGYFTNSVMGYTFDMAGGWKFDVRGNLGHYEVEGDRFLIPGTAALIEGRAEAWNAGITGTIFTLIEMGGGVARPYLSAQYKHVFSEDIEIRGAAVIDFDQANDYGKLEAGYDFVQGAWTYGVAGYTEFSSDENTVGGRIGVSVKLQ